MGKRKVPIKFCNRQRSPGVIAHSQYQCGKLGLSIQGISNLPATWLISQSNPPKGLVIQKAA